MSWEIEFSSLSSGDRGSLHQANILLLPYSQLFLDRLCVTFMLFEVVIVGVGVGFARGYFFIVFDDLTILNFLCKPTKLFVY